MGDRSVQRRLAAVLAADVAGYTRLMEQDSSGTVAAWQDAREDVIKPQVGTFSGKIVKLTGDGFLVEFPTVEDAVRCAIAMQEALALSSLDFRMGVNLGDIIDDGEDIHGEGVNIAARIEALADKGGINISGMVYESIRNRIDARFDDRGEHAVKNVSAPVRVYAVRPAGAAATTASPEALAPPEKLSIAVLPFDNLSGDAEQEYFSDGMAEDLITDLSKLSNLSVTARNSSFSFKGQMPDVKEVAEKLGVAFVLEGSVRKMGDRLRINAQLIGGADGRHVWAERYDGEITEIFDFQDRIRAEIVEALSVQLTPADVTLTEERPTNNVEAYDLCLRGRSEYYRYTPQNFADAKQYFEQAIEIDPGYAEAYGYLSYCLTTMYVFNWPGAEASLDHALELAEKSLALDPRSSVAHSRLGWVLGFLGQYDRAMENFEEAVTLNPRDAAAFYAYGETLNRSGTGDLEKAIALIERAIGLEVIPPPGWEFGFGHSYTLSKRFEEAVGKFLWVLDRLPQLVPAHVQLARTYCEMGRLADAVKSVEILRKISPVYTIQSAERMFPYADAENRRRLRDSLLAAGLPDGQSTGESGGPRPDKPSIAVLPFDNLSGDPEQEYFADGLTEDIITALSHWHTFSVIARNSTYQYKGQSPDIRQVATHLGVRYVLEGSVRKSGNRVRISAQLIDGETGNHVWAERFDRNLDDFFDLQDEITELIAGKVEPEFARAEQKRVARKAPNSLDAWECYQGAFAALHEMTGEGNLRAQNLFRRAIDIDPTDSRAYSGLAYCLFRYSYDGFSGQPGIIDERCTEYAKKAIELNDGDAQAHEIMAIILLHDHHQDEAIAEARRAVEINPNFAHAHIPLGNALSLIGKPAEGIAYLERAIRLNPDEPRGHLYLEILAQAHLNNRDYDKAVELAQQSVDRRGDFLHGFITLASSLGHLSEYDRAEKALAQCKRLRENFLENYPLLEFYRRPEDKAHILEGLRKAGWTEDAPPTRPQKPSIAVLPFDNMSGDPEQEYFSDGMTEDLITDLSKLSNLSVTARNSSFSFKGQMPDVKEVATKLGVAFVLEGSVRKMGDRLRINAQLIGGADGRHIWAERYDGDMADIFDFQDHIRKEIVDALAIQLTPAEVAQTGGTPTSNIEAYELYLRGRQLYFHYSPDGFEGAIRCLNQSIELDPAFADAYAYLSACRVAKWIFHWSDDEDELTGARELAEKAVALAPGSPIALVRLAWVQTWQRQFEAAGENFDKAIAIAPNLSEAYVYKGQHHNFAGEPELGLKFTSRALELDPFAPVDYHLGVEYLLLDRRDEAILTLERARNRTPHQVGTRLHLAWAYIEGGRVRDAENEILAIQEYSPGFTLQDFDRIFPYRLREVRTKALSALRKAGIAVS